MEDEEEFPKGRFYIIVCRKGDRALKLADVNNTVDSLVMWAPINHQDLTQLWHVEKVKDGDYELVNSYTGYGFEESSGNIRLKPGEQKQNQLFALSKSHITQYYQYYWIKTAKNSDKTCALGDYLKYQLIDYNNDAQLFRFEPVFINTFLKNTAIIVNVNSGKVLDVPGGSKEPGEKIIQYTINRRMNQRWKFVKIGKNYQIQSAHTGFNLDIAGEARKPNSKVIQWLPNENTNQMWSFEHKGKSNYLIRSVHEPSLFLGIKDNQLQDGGRLAIVSHEQLWRIEGKKPKI